jgi:hypothetical protein
LYRKGKVRGMRREETMSIKEFMSGEKKKPKKRDTKLYSFIFVNPWSFVDPTVCTIAGIVLLIAILEKFMERKEYFEGMRFIQSIMDVVLPLSGIAALIFFLLEVVA